MTVNTKGVQVRDDGDKKIDYALELNPQQLEAVTSPPGPALVIAGAGSGKTRVLTYRVAYLIEHGAPPESILLLTFTNKAAREMMNRVSELLQYKPRGLWGGTFHSIGNRVLRNHASSVNLGRDFTIMDADDSNKLLRSVIAEFREKDKSIKFPKVEVISRILSLSANTRKDTEEIIDSRYPHLYNLKDYIIDIGRHYESRKRSSNIVDFDDLLVLWLKLLKQDAYVREFYQNHFQHILVDEYQDTNHIQADIIDLLAAGHKQLMVVGDDAQSIYSWRGADFTNIIDFPRRFAGTRIFKIESNYRSAPEILELANTTIALNLKQFQKTLTPTRDRNVKPYLVKCSTAQQQAKFIMQRALELNSRGVPLNNIAVLYRSHFHAMQLQMELTVQNIPFRITSGIRFFEQAHIKDVVAYLRWTSNPLDETAFKRLIGFLPGVGEKTANRIWNVTRLNAQARPSSSPSRILESAGTTVPAKAKADWGHLINLIGKLERTTGDNKAPEMINLVLDSGYEDYLKVTYENYVFRKEDIDQLSKFALQFNSLEEFLSQLSLLTNIDTAAGHGHTPQDDVLQLSTIHQAKGLEFDVVFVIMLCENMFPNARALESADSEDEERRLFYVATTRARDELYLCYPIILYSRNPNSSGFQYPSMFIQELRKELVQEISMTPISPI
ncbi:MAG: ATP-dependent helicase [Verrucomicrobia bacterium]|nr:ATP-dependent helicase [Verrucomicrobiota bacterium]MCF7709195.1 ATP-dependent helicase [Verrucomicrobiota bacterium]